MSEAKWTLPQDEGWYWLIGVCNLPQVVKLVREHGEMRVYFVGSSLATQLQQYESGDYHFVHLSYPQNWEKF